MKVKAKQILVGPGSENKRSRIKKLDAILTVLFILSIVLVIWGIDIYRKTIIEPKYLFVAVCMGTIVAAVFLLFITREFLNAFWTFGITAAIGGGISYFLLLFLNKEFADKTLNTELFPIQKTGNLGRGKKGVCRSPYAIIDFYGLEKQLIFYCEYETAIHSFKRVKVDYFRGFFGFPVVQDQFLFNE